MGNTNMIRRMVSKNKRRFEEDGFSLDLTYVTPQIIAMGFPSDGVEGSFRNNVKDVYRFFETRHPDSYLIVNLCSERIYDPSIFHNRVEFWPFDDHQPPPFEMMRPICTRIQAFLQEKEDNVVAVHCKAGKGRTGVVTVCLLLQLGICGTADEALSCYGQCRTVDGEGVTVKSQRRYCRYFAQNLGMVRPMHQVSITHINIVDPPPGYSHAMARLGGPGFGKEGVLQGSVAPSRHPETGLPLLVIDGCDLMIRGDVHMRIVATKAAGMFRGETEETICSAWFHTSFMPDNGVQCFSVDELDGGPIKDKQRRVFNKSFGIEIHTKPAAKKDKRVHHPASGIVEEILDGSHGTTSGRSDMTYAGSGKLSCSSSIDGFDSEDFARTISEASDVPRRVDVGLVKVDDDLLHDEEALSVKLQEQLSPRSLKQMRQAQKGTLAASVGRAIMLFPFDPAPEDDQDTKNERGFLRVDVNAIVVIFKKCEDGWCLGMHSGEIGWFPYHYCVELSEEGGGDVASLEAAKLEAVLSAQTKAMDLGVAEEI
mmetsp:Transcript_39533/g.98947  ORF Transcript_39533/g.98947 Transcript_39533/m.98947 type:complete len:539 (-) Transcript_39533:219-1835(-)